MLQEKYLHFHPHKLILLNQQMLDNNYKKSISYVVSLIIFDMILYIVK